MIRHATAVLLATALVLVPAGHVRGASTYAVTAQVQPSNRVTDTDPVRLVIRVEGTDLPEVSIPRLPPLANLRVVNGPSTQNQFSWVNGRASATSTMTYVLLPEKPGPAEIPAIQVRIGTVTYRTEPIQLEVVKGQTRPPAAGPPAQGAGPEREGRRGQGGGPDVFLEARLGSTEVWAGQPVSLSVTLFSAADITNFSWRQIPSYSGFWTEDVAVDPNTERYRTTVGGRNYMAYPLEKKVLMPTTPGDLTIEPYAAQFQVRRSPGDLFNDLFSFGRMQDVIRKTEPLQLHVKRLPDAGRPADFGGAVGSFRMTASLDRKEAQVNEAVALKLTVQGDGFLKSVAAPRLDAPPDLKVFDPKVTESTSTAGGKVSSKRTWEWVLVPLVPGDVRVPPPSFSFFDPAQGAYRNVTAEPIQIAVRRAERGEDTVARGEVRLQRHEIAFIKPLRGRLDDSRVRTHQRPWFLAALLSPLLWVPAVVLVGRRQVRLRQDRGFARAGRARTRARKRLRATERHMSSLDSGGFHEEVARSLVEYVGDRFDRPPAGLTYEVAEGLLESRGVDPALRSRFRACLERCDFARFVPDSGREGRKAEVLKEARDLVDLVEKEL